MKFITWKEYMELLEMLKESFSSLEQRLELRFDKIDQRFDKIDEKFTAIDYRLNRIDERLNYHQTWLERIESNMATKNQLNSLLIILKDKEIINSFEVAHIKQADSV
jgi:chromosome segregation ATPase